MSTDIHMIKAGLSDLDKLREIGIRTFTETFAAVNTEDNFRQYLEQGFNTARLAAELGNVNSEFYFAVSGGDIIGYLKLNSGPAQSEMKDSNSLEIERIYVSQSFQGKQVGRLLFDKAMQVAKEAKVSYVWLGVWEKNARAMRFYEKNGFVRFGSHIFKVGDDEQTDIMMRLEIDY